MEQAGGVHGVKCEYTITLVTIRVYIDATRTHGCMCLRMQYIETRTGLYIASLLEITLDNEREVCVSWRPGVDRIVSLFLLSAYSYQREIMIVTERAKERGISEKENSHYTTDRYKVDIII